MRTTVRRLLPHHVVKTFLFERLLLTASATLAVAAVAMGRVRVAEIPGLMDVRLLTLFFVLTIAVELGKDSDLFDRLGSGIRLADDDDVTLVAQGLDERIALHASDVHDQRNRQSATVCGVRRASQIPDQLAATGMKAWRP